MSTSVMMNSGGPVVFNYPAWAARYPELSASVGQTQAQAYFNEAQLYVDNTPCSIIPNCAPVYQRAMFLNMVTAHICVLNAVLGNQPASPLVGHINSATEGSVTVAVENQYPPGTPQWYQQSKYGAAYWAAFSSFRTMHYMPGPRGAFNHYGRSPFAAGG